MTPEISHRCPSCGASIRDAGALFCPECGKALSSAGSESKPASEQPGLETIASQQPAAEETEPKPNSAAQNIAANSPDSTNRVMSAHPHRIADKTRETLHRASAAASAAARGVIEEPAKRVEKIRHASTHVIEEASYDPSLRFVLVALGLFVVFLILLVLSKVMG